jgi:quercetin dioxygenase-like cupin family protein
LHGGKKTGAQAIILDIDLADPSAGKTVVEETLQAFGHIDALLNIAGAVPLIDIFEMTDQSVGGLKERHAMYPTTIDPTATINDPTLAPSFTAPALKQVVTSPESSPELEVRAVFFGRGAHSRWHRHPSPQILLVLSGVGLMGRDDTEQEVRPGEVITFPAQTWHWHGASASTEMHMLSIMRPGPIQWRAS